MEELKELLEFLVHIHEEQNNGDDEDFCGYGDTCESIKRIREGEKE